MVTPALVLFAAASPVIDDALFAPAQLAFAGREPVAAPAAVSPPRVLRI
jgi:hypothetical protein